MTLDLAGIFAAGLLTFASPCVLPLAPVYLSLIGGASIVELRAGRGRRSTLLASAAAFALGLAVVFVVLGLGASAAAASLAAHRSALLLASGAAMVALGLKSLGLVRLPFVDRERRPWLARVTPGGSLLGSFAFGAAFSLGWTPCIGPVLGSVLTYTASAGASPPRGALYLATYAAGVAVPLIAAAAFAPRMLRAFDRLKPHLRKLEFATGLLLVATGALVATDHLMWLAPPERSAAPGTELAAKVPAGAPAPDGGAPVCTGAESTCSVEPGATAGATATAAAATASAPAASHGPGVVELSGRSCPICARMAPVVAAAERGCGVAVEKHDVEDEQGAALARAHAVRGVPTFLILDGSGRELGRLVGEQSEGALRDAMRLVSPWACGGQDRKTAFGS